MMLALLLVLIIDRWQWSSGGSYVDGRDEVAVSSSQNCQSAPVTIKIFLEMCSPVVKLLRFFFN